MYDILNGCVHWSAYQSVQFFIWCLRSEHDNRKEDRRWDFRCRDTFTVTPSCFDSGYVNDFDLTLNFQCPSNYVIAGMSSYHDNRKEDRRYWQGSLNVWTKTFLNDSCCQVWNSPWTRAPNVARWDHLRAVSPINYFIFYGGIQFQKTSCILLPSNGTNQPSRD